VEEGGGQGKVDAFVTGIDLCGLHQDALSVSRTDSQYNSNDRLPMWSRLDNNFNMGVLSGDVLEMIKDVVRCSDVGHVSQYSKINFRIWGMKASCPFGTARSVGWPVIKGLCRSDEDSAGHWKMWHRKLKRRLKWWPLQLGGHF